MTSKKTPFYDASLARGAEMRELFGCWLPWAYGVGHFQEHGGTRERASLCDLDYMAEFRIQGPHALGFIQKTFANDFRELGPGQIRYTVMCDETGCMVDDGTVWRFAEEEFLYISGDEGDYDWLIKQTPGFDVEVRNLTSDWTTLALQGPASARVLASITSTPITELGYYRFTRDVVRGVECVIARIGYTGEYGFELHFHPDKAALWDELFEGSTQEGLVPCGQAALESLRQEAGYLLVGNDHDKTTNPLEAGLGWTVKFGKKEFNGKTALEQILRSGVSRRLVWLKFEGDLAPSPGDPVLVADREVGSITSGSYSPTLGRGVGIAYVGAEYAVPGITIQVRGDDRVADAVLFTMPLYDPGDVRTKGAPA